MLARSPKPSNAEIERLNQIVDQLDDIMGTIYPNNDRDDARGAAYVVSKAVTFCDLKNLSMDEAKSLSEIFMTVYNQIRIHRLSGKKRDPHTLDEVVGRIVQMWHRIDNDQPN